MVLVDPDYFGKEGKKDRKGESKLLLLDPGYNTKRYIHVHVYTHIYNICLIILCSPPLTVFAQVLAGFRYGRDDLDVLGLNFRRDLIDVSGHVYNTYVCTYYVCLGSSVGGACV